MKKLLTLLTALLIVTTVAGQINTRRSVKDDGRVIFGNQPTLTAGNFTNTGVSFWFSYTNALENFWGEELQGNMLPVQCDLFGLFSYPYGFDAVNHTSLGQVYDWTHACWEYFYAAQAAYTDIQVPLLSETAVYSIDSIRLAYKYKRGTNVPADVVDTIAISYIMNLDSEATDILGEPDPLFPVLHLPYNEHNFMADYFSVDSLISLSSYAYIVYDKIPLTVDDTTIGASFYFKAFAAPESLDSVTCKKMAVTFTFIPGNARNDYSIIGTDLNSFNTVIYNDPREAYNEFGTPEMLGDLNGGLFTNIENLNPDYGFYGRYQPLALFLMQSQENPHPCIGLKITCTDCAIVNNCLKPHNPSISEITATTAGVTFSPNQPTDSTWQYAVGVAGFNPDAATTVDIRGTTSFQLSNLTPNRKYEVYVRTVCDSGSYSSWTDGIAFTTMCSPITIPYFHNFDSDESGLDAAFPDCWARIGNGPCPYVNDSIAHSGNNALYFSSDPGTPVAYAVLPYVDAAINPVNTLKLSFYASRPSDEDVTGMSRVVVGVMESPANPGSFVPVETVNVDSVTFQEYTIKLRDYQGTGNYIALQFPAQDSEYDHNSLYLDDIYLDLICHKPTELTTGVIYDNGAILSWTDALADSWEILYGESGFDPATEGITILSDTNSYMITGLTPGTDYEAYVRASCGDGDFSEWTGSVSFTTEICPPMVIPYLYDFDSDDAGIAADFPKCWTRICNGQNPYPFVSSSESYSGNNALYFYAFTDSSYTDAYVALPCVDVAVTPVRDLKLNFYACKGSSSPNDMGQIIVGTMNNTTPTAKFTAIDTINLLSETFQKYTISFKNYSGSDKFIAMRFPKPEVGYLHNLLFVDDISIEKIPDCQMPENLTATYITDTSITLKWTQQTGIASTIKWIIRYRPAADSLNDEAWLADTVTQNPPCTITELTAGTAYQVQICACCANNTFSDYTDILLITTVNIADYTLPNCITLYPNPTSSCINVKFAQDIKVNYWQVYDIYGRILQTIKTNENPTRLDVTGLSSGVYLIRAITDNGIANKTFIKK